MDFLEKLNLLMKDKNLNKNTLSKNCDIPYTTIVGWYKRGYEELKLPTLKKLSNYFNVSLDYWADDNITKPIPQKNTNIILDKEELQLITCYRNLDTKIQSIIKQLIDYETENNHKQ